jgi:hypothetical protein
MGAKRQSKVVASETQVLLRTDLFYSREPTIKRIIIVVIDIVVIFELFEIK